MDNAHWFGFRDKMSGFNIYSKVKLSCTWIDTGLRNPYGVGHLLHAKMGKGGGIGFTVHNPYRYSMFCI